MFGVSGAGEGVGVLYVTHAYLCVRSDGRGVGVGAGARGAAVEKGTNERILR